ncbi:ABC transporter ATP-binding protein/permease [Vineibacter terrae]|uniref:ABC transporter ATP-binding protein/permease n=1 Tax=Vineibacter terrae TaxID=2586908 RepID=A0A5C8PDU6_9HYPH|nr:ABC transporter ATP-binding protein/permease [Vineibacter terrae]TXL71697.1 ABC transporter ATP-binding protein/permease [Vineibacter terrae]
MDASRTDLTRLGRIRAFTRDLWTLALPYFRSEDRRWAWSLLAVVVAINLFLVYMQVQFNLWNGRFYNALQHKDWPTFIHELWVFSGLAVVYIAASLVAFYTDQWLQVRWRRWLTGRVVDSWLAGRAYYRIEMAHSVDNPDQRIADDVRLFVSYTMSLSIGLVSAVATLFTFLFLLWETSGPLVLPLFGTEVSIPGYMVWVALLYAVAGTWLTHVIGRPLINLGFQRQRLEANFRFDLMRLRENAEPIALYQGEARENAGLRARFGEVIDIWWAYIRARTRLALFTTGYNQIAIIFPYVAASPRYFSGAFELGQLMQIADQFSQVQGSLSYFVSAYTDIAEWGAVINRLKGFDGAITHARALQTITRAPHAEPDLTARGLSLNLPDGQALLADVNLDLKPGERTLITGASGSGKSTLFRALAGLWPWGRGKVGLPEGVRVLFLPQKTYLPIGPLREAVMYPAHATAADDDAIAAALRAVDLAPLADKLDEPAHWAQRLSPGEQQRLAVARALLYRPDWLFLDEATASLDEPHEAQLYRLLHEKLPDTTIISIGHRPSLRQWHDRLLTLAPGRDGQRVLAEART